MALEWGARCSGSGSQHCAYRAATREWANPRIQACLCKGNGACTRGRRGNKHNALQLGKEWLAACGPDLARAVRQQCACAPSMHSTAHTQQPHYYSCGRPCFDQLLPCRRRFLALFWCPRSSRGRQFPCRCCQSLDSGSTASRHRRGKRRSWTICICPQEDSTCSTASLD